MSPVARPDPIGPDSDGPAPQGPGGDGTTPGARPSVDPQPETTTGLEPGGGVPPGETPPGEASVAADRVDPGPGARTRAPWLVIGIIVAVTLLVCAMAVGRIMGVF